MDEISRGTKTAKGNARIEEILEAGKNILVDRGFSELTFRNIAAHAGIKVGNVTYYFPNREKLMAALAIYIFDRWDAGFRRRTPEHLTDKVENFEYSIRYMIEENKRPRTNALLQEMWVMASRSDIVMHMLDVFYTKMRDWIESMLVEVNPSLTTQTRHLRAALITAQIEGLIVLIGPRRIPHDDLQGIEGAAVTAICDLAFVPEKR